MCGAVEFSLSDEFKTFYQCHCKQCQQLTGSAFASNMMTDPDNIKWLKGLDQVTRFQHPSRDFSKCFCSTCGSALPWVNKSGKVLIVPAGSLNDAPSIEPKANIFIAEKACWLDSGSQAEEFDGFPD